MNFYSFHQSGRLSRCSTFRWVRPEATRARRIWSGVPILIGLAVSGLVLSVGQAGAQSCIDPHWQQLPCGPPLPVRQDFARAVAYDAYRAQTVLFGGMDVDPNHPTVYGDTWVFEGDVWTQRLPTVSPPRLVGHAMSYDSARHVVVLFGGVKWNDDGTTEVSDETWEWDGQNWTRVPVANPPTRHYDHAMVYDSVRKVHVMYAGREVVYFAGQEVVNRVTTDTWEYDGQARTWTLRSPNGPTLRTGFAMVYDPVRQHTLLFGGRDANLSPIYSAAWFNDLWIWHGEAGIWEQIYPQGFNSPSPRVEASMCFDPGRNVVVLRGGSAPDQFRDEFVTHKSYQTDTWEWNGSAWQEMSAIYSQSPSAYGHVMVYESARQQILLLSVAAVADNDVYATWRATTGNGNAVNYVDASYSGFNQDGSLSTPFGSIRNALPCTIGTGTLIIRSGDYPEGALQLTKQMRLTAELGPVRVH